MSFYKYPYYLSSIWKLLTGIKPPWLVIRVFLNISAPELPVIVLRKTGLVMKTRSAMDIWSIKETFLDRFYVRYGVPVGDGWTILDVGGGIGDFAIFSAANHPGNRVAVFEPTPSSFALLEENIRVNHLDRIQAFNLAVWSSESTLVMDTATGEPVQFSSRPLDAQAKNDGKMLVRSLPLQDALQRAGVETCSLLKMDCEGAEYEILYHTPDSVLRRIERIVMEYHDSASPCTHADLAAFLRDRGYSVSTHPNFVHPDLGYLYAQR